MSKRAVSGGAESANYYRALRAGVECYLERPLTNEEFDQVRQKADVIDGSGSIENSSFIISHALYERFRTVPNEVKTLLCNDLHDKVDQTLRSCAKQGHIGLLLPDEVKSEIKRELQGQLGRAIGQGRTWIITTFVAILAAVALMNSNMFEAGRIFATAKAESEVARLANIQTAEIRSRIQKDIQEFRSQVREFEQKRIPLKYSDAIDLLNGLDIIVDVNIRKRAYEPRPIAPVTPWGHWILISGSSVVALGLVGWGGYLAGRFHFGLFRKNEGRNLTAS